eukprot:TRINITY_DN25993_c0_g1_i1.p2 TRINITY_DN25993_c0_g1~~TRINITY_DN25993_c0_g1_i1.p2  ORF type:complete len:183 (+),score=40.25 TRINITY_DN25993_c0_g1_i1:59-550(+)
MASSMLKQAACESRRGFGGRLHRGQALADANPATRSHNPYDHNTLQQCQGRRRKYGGRAVTPPPTSQRQAPPATPHDCGGDCPCGEHEPETDDRQKQLGAEFDALRTHLTSLKGTLASVSLTPLTPALASPTSAAVDTRRASQKNRRRSRSAGQFDGLSLPPL